MNLRGAWNGPCLLRLRPGHFNFPWSYRSNRLLQISQWNWITSTVRPCLHFQWYPFVNVAWRGLYMCLSEKALKANIQESKRQFIMFISPPVFLSFGRGNFQWQYAAKECKHDLKFTYVSRKHKHQVLSGDLWQSIPHRHTASCRICWNWGTICKSPRKQVDLKSNSSSSWS